MFTQTNLVVDSNPPSGNTDTNLINPWGLAVGPTGIFWASNQGTNTSTLYDSAGNKNQLVVNIPQKKQAPQGNTGTIFNPSSDFEVNTGNPAKFIFVGLDGSISGWNPNVDATNAKTLKDNSATAVYTGVAMGNSGGSNFLYTANRVSGTVDVFDKAFGADDAVGQLQRSNSAQRSEAVQRRHAWRQGVRHLCDEQDRSRSSRRRIRRGRCVRHERQPAEASHRRRTPRVAVGRRAVRDRFGDLANALLVGNFNDEGHINAFDPNTGQFLGTLKDKNGKALSNDELWSLIPGVGADSDAIFFTAGIRDETGGLFGKITASESGGGGNAVPLPNMIYLSPFMLVGVMFLATAQASALALTDSTPHPSPFPTEPGRAFFSRRKTVRICRVRFSDVTVDGTRTAWKAVSR